MNGPTANNKLSDHKKGTTAVFKKFQNTSFKKSINQTDNQLIFQNVDITKHPKVTGDFQLAKRNEELVIGDLHGNALKLLYFLARHGVLDISTQEYDEFVQIYQKKPEKLTKNDIAKFNTILSQSTVNSDSPLIRLIGDEFADRGQNDYFTLKILQKLQKNKVPFEVLVSNHGIELVENYEKNGDFSSVHLKADKAKSLYNLQYLIQEGLVSEDEVNQMTIEDYLPNLFPLSYSLSPDKQKISIYSHAPVGVSAVKAIAQKLNVEYKGSNALELAQTIERIKIVFEHYKNAKKIHTLYSPEIMRKGYEAKEQIDVTQYPFEYLMWNREVTDPNDRPDFATFVNGHDPKQATRDNYVNLDNDLGKDNKNIGEYTIYLSQENQLSLEEKNQIKKEMGDFKLKFQSSSSNSSIDGAENKNENDEFFKILSEKYLSRLPDGVQKIDIEEKIKKALEKDNSIKFALGMLRNHGMINFENINFICAETDTTKNAHQKALYLRNALTNIQNRLTSVIKNTYGKNFENSQSKLHSRILSAKRLSHIDAKSLPELKKILMAELRGLNYSPSFLDLYNGIIKPSSSKTLALSGGFLHHKTWDGQNSKLDETIRAALNIDVLKNTDLNLEDNDQTEFEKVIQQGAHLLLDYVDSRERSLRYKFLYQSNQNSPLSLRIKNAGELAHQLLKCRNQEDLEAFKKVAKRVIKDKKNKNSTLKTWLKDIVENIDNLKSTLVYNETRASGLKDVSESKYAVWLDPETGEVTKEQKWEKNRNDLKPSIMEDQMMTFSSNCISSVPLDGSLEKDDGTDHGGKWILRFSEDHSRIMSHLINGSLF